MRIFDTQCRDNKTGFIRVASECSYNMACDYLLSKFGMDTDMDIDKGADVNLTCITVDKEDGTHLEFVYDEIRGVLLKVENKK